MRSITLLLEDEQFVELYAMAESFRMTNKIPELPIAQLMDEIHNQCEPLATAVEHHIVKVQCENIRKLLTADSPDMYLLKAGMNGLAENLMK